MTDNLAVGVICTLLSVILGGMAAPYLLQKFKGEKKIFASKDGFISRGEIDTICDTNQKACNKNINLQLKLFSKKIEKQVLLQFKNIKRENRENIKILNKDFKQRLEEGDKIFYQIQLQQLDFSKQLKKMQEIVNKLNYIKDGVDIL